MVIKRRKAIAIVEFDKGILLVAGRSKKFSLPGGGAERWESRKKAAIRELNEETGLKTKRIKYLFRYFGNIWHDKNGRKIKNHAKVFLIESSGEPKPRSEIKYISFWKKGNNANLSQGTKYIIERYLRDYKRIV